MSLFRKLSHEPGEETKISWEDSNGRWHDEVAKGDYRPEVDVEG